MTAGDSGYIIPVVFPCLYCVESNLHILIIFIIYITILVGIVRVHHPQFYTQHIINSLQSHVHSMPRQGEISL